MNAPTDPPERPDETRVLADQQPSAGGYAPLPPELQVRRPNRRSLRERPSGSQSGPTPGVASGRAGTRTPDRSPAPVPSTAPAGPAEPTRGRKPRRRGRVVAAWVGGVLAALLAYVLVLGVLTYNRIDRVAAFPSGERPAAGPGTNWLVVGSDSRAGLTAAQSADFGTGDAQGKRTDTIMLLHQSDSGPDALISLPRDSYVPIPGHGRNKINAAFALGGPTLLVQTVEQSTGVHVDGFAEIGFGGFATIVNGLGGVELCPDKAIKDIKADLDIPAGCQRMDGKTALGYVRTRQGGRGDLDRVVRQQQFLSAVGGTITSVGVLANPYRLTRTSLALGDALTVDDHEGPFDLLRFGRTLRAAGGASGVRTTVPVAGTPTLPGVGSVVQWNRTKATALFQAVQADRAIPVG